VWLPLERVRDMCGAEPETFSTWFRAEVVHCRWLEGCGGGPGSSTVAEEGEEEGGAQEGAAAGGPGPGEL
jgi:hypothetical protein